MQLQCTHNVNTWTSCLCVSTHPWAPMGTLQSHVHPWDLRLVKRKTQCRRKNHCGFPWQSVLRLRAKFLHSLLAPQRLAPVIVLHFIVGFMQALAGAPGVSTWRGNLVGARVHGSMEVCGGGGGAIAVGQPSLRSGLHLGGHWSSQCSGRRGPWVHCTG